MSHWASHKFKEFERTISDTEWTVENPPTEKGPIVFTHRDGSELSVVNSSISNTYAVEYKASPSVSTAITDDHTS